MLFRSRDDRPGGDTAAPAAWFRYSPDRKGVHPQTHLKDYAGIVQADAFAGYDKVYATGRVIEAGCWAHARRRFYDIHAKQATRSEEHTSELQSLMRISYAVFCLKKKTDTKKKTNQHISQVINEIRLNSNTTH